MSEPLWQIRSSEHRGWGFSLLSSSACDGFSSEDSSGGLNLRGVWRVLQRSLGSSGAQSRLFEVMERNEAG